MPTESPPTIPADVGRRAMEALIVAVESDLGALWNWPETARKTWMENARAAITELQQALAAPSGGQRTTTQEQGERRE